MICPGDLADMASRLGAVALVLTALAEHSDLAAVTSVRAQWDYQAQHFEVSAVLVGSDDELANIHAIRAWALALNGEVRLGDAFASRFDWLPPLGRQLTAWAALPGGGVLEVVTHLYYAPVKTPVSAA